MTMTKIPSPMNLLRLFLRNTLARVPLQNLVVKFFPEISPVLLCRVMGILGLKFLLKFFCSEYPSKTRPKTS